MKESLSPNTDGDKAKLERLRGELAIGEAQADRGQFAKLTREEVQQNLKQAREDIESGNLFDAETVFKELRKSDF